MNTSSSVLDVFVRVQSSSVVLRRRAVPSDVTTKSMKAWTELRTGLASEFSDLMYLDRRLRNEERLVHFDSQTGILLSLKTMCNRAGKMFADLLLLAESGLNSDDLVHVGCCIDKYVADDDMSFILLLVSTSMGLGDVIKDLLAIKPYLAQRRTRFGRTGLHVAAYCGRPTVLEYFFQQHVDPFLLDFERKNAMDVAIEAGMSLVMQDVGNLRCLEKLQRYMETTRTHRYLNDSLVTYSKIRQPKVTASDGTSERPDSSANHTWNQTNGNEECGFLPILVRHPCKREENNGLLKENASTCTLPELWSPNRASLSAGRSIGSSLLPVTQDNESNQRQTRLSCLFQPVPLLCKKEKSVTFNEKLLKCRQEFTGTTSRLPTHVRSNNETSLQQESGKSAPRERSSGGGVVSIPSTSAAVEQDNAANPLTVLRGESSSTTDRSKLITNEKMHKQAESYVEMQSSNDLQRSLLRKNFSISSSDLSYRRKKPKAATRAHSELVLSRAASRPARGLYDQPPSRPLKKTKRPQGSPGMQPKSGTSFEHWLLLKRSQQKLTTATSDFQQKEDSPPLRRSRREGGITYDTWLSKKLTSSLQEWSSTTDFGQTRHSHSDIPFHDWLEGKCRQVESLRRNQVEQQELLSTLRWAQKQSLQTRAPSFDAWLASKRRQEAGGSSFDSTKNPEWDVDPSTECQLRQLTFDLWMTDRYLQVIDKELQRLDAAKTSAAELFAL